jgi:hypothetical protein
MPDKSSAYRLASLALSSVLILLMCRLAIFTATPPIVLGPWSWQELAFDLPPSIKVYKGRASGPQNEPVRAWRVEIDYSDRRLQARPYLADGPSGREPASVQAKRVGAYVAVNGGYFDMESVPAKTYSLVLQDGKVLRENIGQVHRATQSYFVTRSAFGITTERKFSFAWIVHRGGKIFQLPNPLSALVKNNRVPEVEQGKEWKMQEGIGGGPRLIEDGRERITFTEEVFFGSGFDADTNYSRCAVATKPNDKLMLFVVDGSIPEYSVGLTLHQLAQELLLLGCTEAMNLDGGGSQTLVVNGKTLNRSSDGQERPVTSIFAIVPATPRLKVAAYP